MVTKEARSLLTASIAHGVMHSYLVILPALLPSLKSEIGDYSLLGVLISVLFLIYGWGGLPAGIAADRISKKLLIVASMMTCGVSSILISLSQGLLSLSFSLMLLGIGTSLYHPAGFSLVSMLSNEFRGRYMGIHGVGGNAGMALAYVASGTMSLFFGWRNTFLVWGLIGLGMGLVVNTFITEPEQTKIKENIRLRILSKEFVSINLAVIGLLFLVIICSGALWDGVSAFLVTYVKEVKGSELFIAGGIATVSYLFGSLAQLVGGVVSDKVGRGLALMLGFGSYSLMLFLFTLRYVGSPVMITVIASMLGFTFFVTQSPLSALLGDISPVEMRGLTYGFNFAIKYGIGGVTPAVAGYLAVRYSMDSIFYLFALISAISFVASIALFLLMRNDRSNNLFK